MFKRVDVDHGTKMVDLGPGSIKVKNVYIGPLCTVVKWIDI